MPYVRRPLYLVFYLPSYFGFSALLPSGVQLRSGVVWLARSGVREFMTLASPWPHTRPLPAVSHLTSGYLPARYAPHFPPT